jgi:hypothetical protein
MSDIRNEKGLLIVIIILFFMVGLISWGTGWNKAKEEMYHRYCAVEGKADIEIEGVYYCLDPSKNTITKILWAEHNE